MNFQALSPTLLVVLTTCFLLPVRAEPVGDLDGAAGAIFKVDPANQRFELLKETEYDPQTDIKQSRFTVSWTEETAVTKVGEREDFAGIESPVMATFYGIRDEDFRKFEEGKPFEARVAVLYFGTDKLPAADDGRREVSGWFTPSADEGPRAGTIETDDGPVGVKLRNRNWKIHTRESLNPAALAEGFWTVALEGSRVDGDFVVERMEVTPKPDPRATDDPDLPRVLVIGDSISMNYHEAAKAALEGEANYHRIEDNAASVIHGVRNADLWLGNHREEGLHWDVIQFNHGLHDLKQSHDKESDTWGEYVVPLDEYRENLEKLIAILKKTGAELIWCSTTPVPNDNKGRYARRKGAAAEFNEAAMEIVEKHPEILVTDLYQVVEDSPVFDEWRKGTDVHFYRAEEREALGEAVAGTVRESLD